MSSSRKHKFQFSCFISNIWLAGGGKKNQERNPFDTFDFFDFMAQDDEMN